MKAYIFYLFFLMRRKDLIIFMVKSLDVFYIVIHKQKKKFHLVNFYHYCISLYLVYVKLYKSDLFYLIYLKLIYLHTFFFFFLI